MAYPDFLTGEDVLLYVLAQGGQKAATTDDHATLCQANVHLAYWSLLAHKAWTFAKARTPKVVTTDAKVSATVSSISGATVTLSDTISTSQAGKKFYLDSNQATYRISAHTGGTNTLTLDATYVETVTTGLCTIYQDEYALATDVIRPYGPFWLRGQFQGEVDLLAADEFTARFGRNTSQTAGLVEAVAVIRDSQVSEDQAPIIQIAPWSESRVNLEYEYAERHVLTFDGEASTDTPKVPREFRWVIGEWALWLLFRKKSDDSIMPTNENIAAGLRLMADLYVPKANRPRFYTRPRFTLGGTR